MEITSSTAEAPSTHVPASTESALTDSAPTVMGAPITSTETDTAPISGDAKDEAAEAIKNEAVEEKVTGATVDDDERKAE